MPADVRAEKERELASLKHDLDAATEKRERSEMVGRYHMVRFFERQKATRRLKAARKEVERLRKKMGAGIGAEEGKVEVKKQNRARETNESGAEGIKTGGGGDKAPTGSSSAMSKLQQAEKAAWEAQVDLNYTLYAPLREKYRALYPSTPLGRNDAFGKNLTSVPTRRPPLTPEQEAEEAREREQKRRQQQQEREKEKQNEKNSEKGEEEEKGLKGVLDMSAAEMMRAFENPSARHGEMWCRIEAAMKENEGKGGIERALEEIREAKPEEGRKGEAQKKGGKGGGGKKGGEGGGDGNGEEGRSRKKRKAEEGGAVAGGRGEEMDVDSDDDGDGDGGIALSGQGDSGSESGFFEE